METAEQELWRQEIPRNLGPRLPVDLYTEGWMGSFCNERPGHLLGQESPEMVKPCQYYEYRMWGGNARLQCPSLWVKVDCVFLPCQSKHFPKFEFPAMVETMESEARMLVWKLRFLSLPPDILGRIFYLFALLVPFASGNIYNST